MEKDPRPYASAFVGLADTTVSFEGVGDAEPLVRLTPASDGHVFVWCARPPKSPTLRSRLADAYWDARVYLWNLWDALRGRGGIGY